MAGTIARRHPNRARTFSILFPHRYLRSPQHHPEFALLAIFNLPALNSFQSRCSHGPVARLILRVVRAYANGPQGRGYKSYPNSTQ
jgi:hypothetical protein